MGRQRKSTCWLSADSPRAGCSEIPEGMEDLREGMKSPGSPLECLVDQNGRGPEVSGDWGLEADTA